MLGIEPEFFEGRDVMASLSEQTRSRQFYDSSDQVWTQMIIVSKSSSLYLIQNFVYVLLCLLSSFIYMWFASFG